MRGPEERDTGEGWLRVTMSGRPNILVTAWKSDVSSGWFIQALADRSGRRALGSVEACPFGDKWSARWLEATETFILSCPSNKGDFHSWMVPHPGIPRDNCHVADYDTGMDCPRVD